MPINEYRSIKIFARAAELGSLRAAAAVEGITPQAASQALAQLERHLEVRLFHRTTRNISLTAEGRAFLDAVHPSMLGLQQALDGLRHARDDVAGPLRIVGPRSSFRPVLSLLLDELGRRHPHVLPDVQLDDRIGNWVADQVDVGFRLGVTAEEGVVARRLFPLQLIACASPAYLQAHGMPDSLAALAEHRCSVFRWPSTRHIVPWHVKVEGTIVDHEVAAAFCTSDEDLEIDAVLAGRVIAMLTNVTAIHHIRSGRLVPLLTQHVADNFSLHVYYGSRKALPARVRAFVDMTTELLVDRSDFVLTAKELAAAEQKGRKAHTARKPR